MGSVFSNIKVRGKVIYRRPRSWLENIREIGNVIFDPKEHNRRYRTWFTAYSNGYDGYNVVIGHAYSETYRKWTLRNTFFQHAEDPYVVKHENSYYMFYEKKKPHNIHIGIGRAHSSDGENWVDDGLVLRKSEDWESHDVSSPCVWIENGVWKMLYEGRSPSGRVGVAISEDGLSWQKFEENPVFSGSAVQGSWDSQQVVCDDIAVFEGKHYMLYHGYSSEKSWRQWMPGLAMSDDLLNWTRKNNPLNKELSHAMFFRDDRDIRVLGTLPGSSDIYLGELT